MKQQRGKTFRWYMSSMREMGCGIAFERACSPAAQIEELRSFVLSTLVMRYFRLVVSMWGIKQDGREDA